MHTLCIFLFLSPSPPLNLGTMLWMFYLEPMTPFYGFFQTHEFNWKVSPPLTHTYECTSTHTHSFSILCHILFKVYYYHSHNISPSPSLSLPILTSFRQQTLFSLSSLSLCIYIFKSTRREEGREGY